jgi:hypothetical protein
MKVISKCLYTVCFLILVSLHFHFLIPQTRGSAIVESKLRDSSEHSSYVRDVLNEHKKQINIQIASELREIYNSQRTNLIVLEEAIKFYGVNSTEVSNVIQTKFYQDSINLHKVEQIIDKYGWPQTEAIGAQNNYTLFTVIQNSDFKTQERYLPIMKQAVKSGDLLPESFANLIDRKAITEHGLQVFGTMLKKEADTYSFAPIAEEETVNERRKEIGLCPIEDFAKRNSIEYHPVEKPI